MAQTPEEEIKNKLERIETLVEALVRKQAPELLEPQAAEQDEAGQQPPT